MTSSRKRNKNLCSHRLACKCLQWFGMAPNWTCPSVGEWPKLWYSHRLEFFSTKRDALLILCGREWPSTALCSLKNPDSKGYMLYDSIPDILEKAELLEQKTHKAGVMKVWPQRSAWENFRVMKLFYSLTVVVITWLFVSVTFIELDTKKGGILLYIKWHLKKNIKTT